MCEVEFEAIINTTKQLILEERHNYADLLEVFKMAHGLSAISLDQMFHPDISRQTRSHSLKLIKYRCNRDVNKYFFIPGYFKVEHVG